MGASIKLVGNMGIVGSLSSMLAMLNFELMGSLLLMCSRVMNVLVEQIVVRRLLVCASIKFIGNVGIVGSLSSRLAMLNFKLKGGLLFMGCRVLCVLNFEVMGCLLLMGSRVLGMLHVQTLASQIFYG